jgi:uncharacterized protein YdeI (YjbR/CyaY-like superfamily)
MTGDLDSKVRFFTGVDQLRRWFEENHGHSREVWIGYYKRGSGKAGVTYLEAVEEALCFGWVDGQVRSLDRESHANRYTPRRPGSRWSRVNVEKAERLIRSGRMHPEGLRAFERRDPEQRAGHSFEERPRTLSPDLEEVFRRSRGAWQYFESQPPSYRRTALFWVMEAKRPETRGRRLQRLVDVSTRRERMDTLSPGHRRSPDKPRGHGSA